MKIKNYRGFDCFLEYIKDPDFHGAIVSDDPNHFRGSQGLFEQAVKFFNEASVGTKSYKMPLKIQFPSGATIRFLSVDNTCGMVLNAALVLHTNKISYEDVLQVKTRIRQPCSNDGSLWFLESY